MPALRLALRALRKDRWFSLAAIVTLGLGIGATSAVFAILLRSRITANTAAVYART